MTDLGEAVKRNDGDDNLVWHYTSGAALKEIVTKHELWASNTAFMNDSRERRLADEYLVKAKNDLGKDFPKMLDSYIDHVGDWYDNLRFSSPHAPDGTRYLLSASKRGDSLTMWRGYAGTDEVSYAIGIDPTAPLSILAPPTNKQMNHRRKSEISHWFDVNYNPEDAERLAKEAVDRMVGHYRAPAATREELEENISNVFDSIDEVTEPLRNTTKHQGFVHEEEVRIIVDADRSLTRYHSGRLGMVPYVVLTGSDDSSSPIVTSANKLPIRKIRMSPGPDRFFAIRSLVELLHANGYNYGHDQSAGGYSYDVEVLASEIPFR